MHNSQHVQDVCLLGKMYSLARDDNDVKQVCHRISAKMQKCFPDRVFVIPTASFVKRKGFYGGEVGDLPHIDCICGLSFITIHKSSIN